MTKPSDIKLAPRPVVKDEKPSRLKAILFAFVPPAQPDLVKARQAHELGGNSLGGGKILGDGIRIAVLDSGCRASHRAFFVSDNDPTTRVLPGRNFAGGADTEISDATGHGTSVSGLAAARKIAPIVAPLAQILPLKVCHDDRCDFDIILKAFSWLLNDEPKPDIGVVCFSMGDAGNWPSFDAVSDEGEGIRQQVADKIRALRAKGIPTVAAAGNGYFSGNATVGPGMCFPAIMEECISVGAVFTSSPPGRTFSDYGGAKFDGAIPMQLAPFSQRLPKNDGNPHFTRLFAPGAAIRSAGTSDDAIETMDLYGTSAAAPCVAGVIALLQEWHKKKFGQLPSCAKLEKWLLAGADLIVDNPAADNVTHTGATFRYVNAFGAMKAMIEDVATS